MSQTPIWQPQPKTAPFWRRVCSGLIFVGMTPFLLVCVPFWALADIGTEAEPGDWRHEHARDETGEEGRVMDTEDED